MNSAVLFLTYRRFNTAEKVFESIRQAKPPRLYFASNAPNPDNAGEEQRVAEVRALIERIDWPCKLYTLFRDKHLSVKYSIPSAIDWFFETEEMGIILEDDCLPSKSFYYFCDKLLERYKFDMRIWHITGDNFQDGIKRGGSDYYFSNYAHVWGWATWKSRWINYDIELSNINPVNKIQALFSKKEFNYWHRIFKLTKENKINTWDYQWLFTIWSNDAFSVIPNKNLVSNIGYGIDAEHTLFVDKFSNMDRFELFKTNFENDIIVCKAADQHTFNKHYKRNIFRTIEKIALIILTTIKRLIGMIK